MRNDTVDLGPEILQKVSFRPALPARRDGVDAGSSSSPALDPGRHRLAVRTCPAEGQVGFYALARSRESAPP